MLWCSSFSIGTECGAHIKRGVQKWCTVSRIYRRIRWEQPCCYLPRKFTHDNWVLKVSYNWLSKLSLFQSTQTVSLALISMKKRCSVTDSEDTTPNKAVMMAEIKKNLPIEMRVNDLYGLSHSMTNISQRGSDVFDSEMRRQKSQISVYEDVN